MQLDGDAVSPINLQPGHSCSKCGFLLSEDMCDVFDKLPELENDLAMDTKMALFHIAGYIVRKDEVSDHTFSYHEKYGNFTDDLNRGGLQIPGDSACQWIFYCYIMFHEVVNAVCRTSLCNLLMSISDFYGLNMQRKHGMIMANVLFKNYCYLYSPRSEKEPKQKNLKLGD